jgi:hypothetical protein
MIDPLLSPNPFIDDDSEIAPSFSSLVWLESGDYIS